MLLAIGGTLLLSPASSRAEPAREALVLGNGTYGALPPVPACLQAAHAVAAALRQLGFHVVEREDVSTGGTDAAIGEFAKQLESAPGAAAFVYSCGYATSFNDRPFLLPVSARITRPADVLTQGMLAKLLIDVIVRGGTGSSVVAMDVIPMPDAPTALGLEALAKLPLPDTMAMLAVSQAKPPDAPTPLALALIAGLKGPVVQTAPLLASLQQQIASKPVTLAALRAPVTAGYLAGAPAPPPPAPPPPPPVVIAPPVVQTTVTPPPPPPPPFAAIPAEEQMTEADRRAVQTALRRLGYYPGPIDGLFGSDTRAAIRRYQHEVGADMTARLTAAQASRLVSGQ